MKKLSLLIFLSIAGISIIFAQTQQGYVKTRGRLAANGSTIPGTRLSGATLTFKGNKTVVSGNNGVFTFSVPSKTFCVMNVQKNGYQLYDRDLLGRTHNYSTNDLLIVMDTPDKVLADKIESERRYRRIVQKQLDDKEDELVALKEQQKISEERYRKLLQELATERENSRKIVSDMAERFSTMDFDQMDDFWRRVEAYIINGELTRADSLLKTKGSMGEWKARIEQERATLDANAERLKKETEEQKRGEALQEKDIEEFATCCYKNYEICLLQQKRDSAAYWLEERASIDTLNVSWQFEAGMFLSDYLADYGTALRYYHRALYVAIAQEGEKGENVASSYNNIGFVYSSQGEYSNALEMYQKALKIELEIFGASHPYVSASYIILCDCYWKAKSKGIELTGFREFTGPRVFTATTAGSETSALKAGMSGEYYVLEFADWTIDSESSLYEKNEEMRGKPKTIVVMKDGVISQYHFENTIGVQFGYKCVGEQEKQRILKAYKEWKEKQ